MINKQHATFNTNPDMFTPAYSGNINMLNGNVYKSNDKQNEILIPNNYPETIVYTSQFFTDWCYDEVKILPYQLDDVLLQPNELVHAHVLNASFEKLYTNIEYILSRCYFFANIIPTEYVGWFGCALNMTFIDLTGDNNEISTYATYHVDNTYKFHSPVKPCYQYFPCRYASVSGWTTESDLISTMDVTSMLLSGGDKFKALGSNETDKLDPDNKIYPTNIEATSSTIMSAYSSAKYAVYDDILGSIDITSKAGKKYSLFVASSAITFQQFDYVESMVTYDDYNEPHTSYGYNITEDQSKRIDSVNGKPYKQITSVSISDAGYFYIYDAEYNTINQYNLNYILNDDKLLNKIPLTNIIGGRDITDQHLYKFDKLKFIKCSGKYLFAYDENEYNIIVFDEYLNYIRSISNTGFTYHSPVDITYRQLQKEYYILCSDGKIFVLSTDFKVVRDYQLSDSEIDNYKAIKSSTVDSNVYYVALSDSMLQKLYSNNKTVGKFSFGKFGIVNDTFKWWRSTNVEWSKCLDLWQGSYNFPSFTDTFNIKSVSINSVNNKDEIWIFANNGRLVWLVNDLKQQSLLKDVEKLRYNKNDLKISEQDYLQSFTYNRIIRRYLDIFNSIAAHIAFQPTYVYDSAGNLTYDHLSYITTKLNTNDILKNLKIYDNDILTTDVINRVFTHLIELQQQLLDKTQLKKENTKYRKFDTLVVEI